MHHHHIYSFKSSCGSGDIYYWITDLEDVGVVEVCSLVLKPNAACPIRFYSTLGSTLYRDYNYAVITCMLEYNITDHFPIDSVAASIGFVAAFRTLRFLYGGPLGPSYMHHK